MPVDRVLRLALEREHVGRDPGPYAGALAAILMAKFVGDVEECTLMPQSECFCRDPDSG